MSCQIAILDDHPMICDAVEYQANQHADFDFAGRYTTLASARDLLDDATVDVLVCDLHLPDGMAVPLIRQLVSETEMKVVVYTANVHPVISSICEAAGAVATMTKSHFGDDFLLQVTEVLRKPVALQETASAKESPRGETAGASQVGSRVTNLTEREWDVLLLMGEGLSTGEIASRLFISNKTVESHRAAIKRKLAVDSKDRLISMAARWMGIPA